MATDPPAVNDIVELRVYNTALDQLSVNVRHYRVSSVAVGGVSLAAIAAYFDGLLAPLYKPCMSLTATYRGVVAAAIYPLPKIAGAVGATHAGAGTSGATDLPLQVSGIITLRSGSTGRANRGRVYIPFPSTDDAADGERPTVAYRDNLTAIGSVYAANQTVTVALSSTVLQPVVYHRFFPGVNTPLVSGTGVQKWATQRRRGAYGRANTSPV